MMTVNASNSIESMSFFCEYLFATLTIKATNIMNENNIYVRLKVNVLLKRNKMSSIIVIVC